MTASASTLMAAEATPHLLVVDDNPGDVELLSIALEMASLPVHLTIATDGQAALDVLRDPQVVFDLILLDLNMPRRNGMELLAELGGRPGLSAPIVVWTSSSSERERLYCLAHGAAAFFTKPERIAEYLSLVTALQRYFAPLPPAA